jgi:hypothetical protein
VTAFAYSASETVDMLPTCVAEVVPEGPVVGAREDADFSWLIDLATVICTWDSAALTPTRATDAAPMAAIDSATASQPTASPAT